MSGQRDRQARGVVNLQPELRQAAGVSHGVRGAEDVTCLGMDAIQDVPGFEVSEAEASHDVRTAHDEDREVHEEKQERGPRRQGSDEQDPGENDDLDAPQHRSEIRPR